MIKIMLALTFFSSITLAAELPVQLRCITPLPTTSFIVDTQNDKVRMSLVHHNGSKYMPIFTGTITPSDFPYLQDKAALLTRIPENITVEWNRSDCKTGEAGIFECTRGGDLQLGDLKVSSPAFLTSRSTRRTVGMTVERVSVKFSFIVYNGSFGYFHDIQMDYNLDDCVFPNRKSNRVL